MGKLIVFEGTDGTGKSTQYARACERLEAQNVRFEKIKFPQYDEPSSALIKMYLAGEFGSDPEKINPYAASTFYAVDRYAGFARGWKDFYDKGGLIVCDRYTTSNAVHQGSHCLPVPWRGHPPHCQRPPGRKAGGIFYLAL